MEKEDEGSKDRQGRSWTQKKKPLTKHPQQRNITKEKEENTNPLARVFGDMHRLNVFLESRQQSLDTHISQSLHQQHKHTHTHTHTIHKLHEVWRIKQSLKRRPHPMIPILCKWRSPRKVKEIGGKCLNQCWCCWPVLSSSGGAGS
jgi:hypothetical protein